MKYIQTLTEKGKLKWQDSDAPDANGRFRDLSPKDLAAWLIKTRKGDMKKISGSLSQQVAFNKNDDPEYAKKMDKTRIEVYKQMDREDLLESINEAKMPKKYIGNDEIVFLKTKEDSRGAHYNLYYKGYDIDKGGHRFGSEKELEDFASNYILSNQLYKKLRYEDSIPLPESVDMDDLKNAKEQLSNPHTILDITYDKTRRGDKFVRFDYENKYVPGKMLDSGPHFVNVRYDNNKDLKKISKELGMDLKESVLNEEDTWNDYPAAAKKNAQKAIDWKEKYGRDEVDAGTPVGWARAHQLAKGENLSTDTVKRMSAFNRHRKNSSIKPELKETPWKDRGYVAWLIWGGDEGVDWAIEKSKEIDAMKESKQMKYIKPVSESYWTSYDYDKWTKENGKPKYPKWVKSTLKEIVQKGFMEPVYDDEHNYMVLWLASLENKRRSELYAYDKKGIKEFGKVGYAMYQRFYNDLTGYNMFFMQGALAALEVSKNIEDRIANGEFVEPAYYMMKEYFNSFGMDTKRSRVFNAAVKKLEAWMQDNKLDSMEYMNR